MKFIKLIVVMGALIAPMLSIAASTTETRTNKTASNVCLNNAECADLVSIQLTGMYYSGLNEPNSVTIGTYINRKSKELHNFCDKASDKKVCESYKNQLMIQYITGLLDR